MNTIIYKIFKISILLLFLQSMLAWFLWNQQVLALLFAVSSILILIAYSGNLFSFSEMKLIPILLIIVAELYVVRSGSINAQIAAVLRIGIISMVILLKNHIKIDLLHFLTKSFAIILLLSLAGWMLFIIGVKLHHFRINYNNGQYWFDNYIFFLYNHKAPLNLFIPRYSSIFLEPGQLGMITSFLLCANRFDLKNKSVLIILIATLFTFSLAAYVLLIVSFSAYITLNSMNPVRNFSIWIFSILLVYIFFSNLNNGDNIVNILIFDRLKYQDGTIVGNNRFTSDLANYFERFMSSNDKLFGLGAERYLKINWSGGNAGYKVFLIQHGIVGTSIIFFLYLSLVLLNKSKMALILFVVYILCFLQAAYPLWECQLLIFITALPFFKSNINNSTSR